MNKKRELGIERPITRRDILHGFGSLAAASFVPGAAFADATLAAELAGSPYYPPALTGMRGNHEGSYDVSHQLARYGKSDWGPVETVDTEIYDLVVVGAGLSGLAAAHRYQQENPQARILLLDNHDDFGGHAKRNEFDVDGHKRIGYGGSQSLEEPSSYPEAAKTLLKDLDIDIETLGAGYDQDFYKRNGLAAGVQFRRADWGADQLVRLELGPLSYLPLDDTGITAANAIAEMPLSAPAKEQLLRILTTTTDQIGMSPSENEELLYGISYRDYLERYLKVDNPEVFAVLQDLTLDFGAGIEAVSAGNAMGYGLMPGADAAGLPQYPPDESYIHHFPDGNATVARLLVRQLIPDVAPGSTPEDVLLANFDYSKLDVAGSKVAVRLNSTVIKVQHDGDPQTAKRVGIDYVQDGKACRITARHCILACYNASIPSLCPDLPTGQVEALSMGVKSPILYTTVALDNWRAWKNLGIGAVVSSGSYHPLAMLDFPMSYGGQEYPDNPDQPMLVHMERFAHRNNEGLTARQQRRVGRHELLATSFETMEVEIREQLAALLGEGGFDPARDITGITVNRWAHGYSDAFFDLEDPWLGGRNDPRRPNVRGRQPFGRITIANSDAGAMAMFETAVSQAYRAVEELE